MDIIGNIILMISLAVQLAAADRPVDPLGACDFTFIDQTGVITSPNFPNAYAANSNCTWLIFGSPGKNIQLTFTAFLTELNVDVVKVFDGPTVSSPLLLNHSGSSVPVPVVSSANSMIVQLVTNAVNQFSGFRAEYQQIVVVPTTTTMAPVPECGGELYGNWKFGPPKEENPPGIFVNYAPNLNCTWYLQSASSNNITVQFDSTFCTEVDLDYVKIWEGWNATGDPVKYLTGPDKPSEELQYTSQTTNRLTVLFHSNESRSCKAFTAHSF